MIVLDVYVRAVLSFNDRSNRILHVGGLTRPNSRSNVILASCQRLITKGMLENIAKTTPGNLDEFFSDAELTNEVCYNCESGKVLENCRRTRKKRCF